MKGQSPRVVLQSRGEQTVLSAVPALFTLFRRAPVGCDLRRAAPRLKPPIVPGFHAGAWEAVEGSVLAPGVCASSLACTNILISSIFT